MSIFAELPTEVCPPGLPHVVKHTHRLSMSRWTWILKARTAPHPRDSNKRFREGLDLTRDSGVGDSGWCRPSWRPKRSLGSGSVPLAAAINWVL
eukprot:1372136-Amorphochlora_amoeboformis.AAC.1